jgi:hypothetical protein
MSMVPAMGEPRSVARPTDVASNRLYVGVGAFSPSVVGYVKGVLTGGFLHKGAAKSKLAPSYSARIV